MHIPKKEYKEIPAKKKVEDAPKIRCKNCNKIIAEGRFVAGVLFIKCKHCGHRNDLSAKPDPKY